ncbi:helix-turn-helix domain-containing protein [Lysinibacillus xylanilyticus]|uniref:LexA family protein n=1 Tax=Lysinibacillus xylanilyticus TaxID=582475 RepID=UPI002B254042|nr:helix-turn-helix domain-containing protein [Lysinibacillus xylanilyticus]MEB2279703.1 helix-turn-helix domain-containing protein [Lysinibacillus xylanilyticus]
MYTTSKGLGDRKKQIIQFIHDFRQQNTYAPTVREIAEGVSLSSVSTVQRHLINLVEKGYIEMEQQKPRTIRLTEMAKEEL